MSIRDVKTQTLIEQIVCYVADDIHYGGGPRMQEIAGELADKYPLVNAAPQLREALWDILGVLKTEVVQTPKERECLNMITRIAKVALAAAEKE